MSLENVENKILVEKFINVLDSYRPCYGTEERINLSNARMKKILKMRYGIGYDTGLTFEEIGQEYFLSKERVRQIILKAQKIIKNRISCYYNINNFQDIV